MKHVYSLLACAVITFSATAQNAATPNAGFETWTHVSGFTAYDDPNNWSTLNSTTSSFGAITCYKATTAGEYHAGAAGLKLVTKNVVIQVAQGIATTGTLNTTNQTITGGLAYTGRPDSIVGWYKCSPVNNDAGFVQFMLLGAASDTIGYAKLQAPTTPVTTMTRFAVAITYSNANTPVTSQWIISSSAGSSGQQVNATIWVDDLDLTFAPASVLESQRTTGISLGPVPASQTLTVHNAQERKGKLVLYNTLGQSCASFDLAGKSTTIDVSTIPQGTYLYSVLDENNQLLQSAKLVISR